jgi:hypothetical protein
VLNPDKHSRLTQMNNEGKILGLLAEVLKKQDRHREQLKA